MKPNLLLQLSVKCKSELQWNSNPTYSITKKKQANIKINKKQMLLREWGERAYEMSVGIWMNGAGLEN